ncbi:MAG: hypothetical protein WCW13_02975 [archaeon]|jgi:hypothetical protein
MAKNESIIEVIQKMVQEGQPREKILVTLHELGVTDEQSQKLLLIAEADTFTLLKKEINNMVREGMVSQKGEFEGLIRENLSQIENEEKVVAGDIARRELKEVKDDMLSESKGFEERINKVISDSQKTVSMVKVALDSLNNRLAQMELDVEQLKVHKFRKKSMFFSYAMLTLGAIILCLALYLLFTNFTRLDIAQIIMICVLILASVTLMFASIIG